MARVLDAARRRLTRKPRAHFIHLPKTGGTAIHDALVNCEFSGHYHLCLHPHRFKLEHVQPGERFFFAYRDPIDKFVSGFYTRLRCGRPRRNNPWNEGEQRIFGRFSTPNELAEALAPGAPANDIATFAMGHIVHFRSYWEWFTDEQTLTARADDLLAAIPLPRLNELFPRLTAELGVSASLPTDDVRTHRNPADTDKRLSDAAVANLREWYARDYAFVDLCDSLGPFPHRSSTT